MKPIICDGENKQYNNSVMCVFQVVPDKDGGKEMQNGNI